MNSTCMLDSVSSGNDLSFLTDHKKYLNSYIAETLRERFQW